MIDIGRFLAKTCNGVSRRSFLKVGAALPFLPAAAAEAVESAPRARSVLFVFLWGAPSHLDTCDPKPNAPSEYRGPFGVIPTRTPGVHFTELLPRVAQRSHRFTLVRSHVTSAPGHPDGGTVALTGFEEAPGPVQPNFGSIIARHNGHQSGALPPFFSIASGMLADAGRRIEGYGGGTLGGRLDPFMVGASENGVVSVPALHLLDDLNPGRIGDRQLLRTQLDRVPKLLDSSRVDGWQRTYRKAYELLSQPASRDACELTRESPPTRARYGRTVFGQSALLARRLVEAGVPYVQLNYSRHPEAMNPGFEFGWDTHIYNFELLQDQHCPVFDRAFSALLDDLHDRGLDEHTLVVCMGEFGRTPKINHRAARDHWPQCYFSIWSGAGIEGGRVIGQSDKLGEHPVTDPLSPLMVGTTIAELCGVNTEARAAMRVLDDGRVIEGLA
ncbi:MAG: DUF1501 domain-containing protein [Planctomycetaceae bacterium]|nr:DUF1501 domain-containing protein [Planctomycetaceae bacterium]